MRLLHGVKHSTWLKISVVVPILALAACSGAVESTPSATAPAATADPTSFAAQHYTTPLADVCPNPLIIQKDWLPEVEQNAIYQLIGGGGTATQNNYSGPLGSSGIQLTILDGGQGLGTQLLELFVQQGFGALFVTHSIVEAVYLSSRVLVMSARPGRIVAEFTVPFGLPRRDDLRFDPAFAQLCGQVSDALRDGGH